MFDGGREHTSTNFPFSFEVLKKSAPGKNGPYLTNRRASGEERCVTSDDPNNGCEGD